jgi:hypothetical protein
MRPRADVWPNTVASTAPRKKVHALRRKTGESFDVSKLRPVRQQKRGKLSAQIARIKHHFACKRSELWRDQMN